MSLTFTRPTRTGKAPVPHEHRMQVALFKWAALAAGADPRLSMLFAIGNGGKRNVIVAKKMKAEGVKAGVPDVFLPIACGGYHGLWLELKVGKNKPSAEQTRWHINLTRHNYRVEVVHDDWDRARRIIEDYLRASVPSCENRPGK